MYYNATGSYASPSIGYGYAYLCILALKDWGLTKSKESATENGLLKQRFFIGIDGSMKNINIHKDFPFHKRFFIVKKESLGLYSSGKQSTVPCKVLWGTQHGSSMVLLWAEPSSYIHSLAGSVTRDQYKNPFPTL